MTDTNAVDDIFALAADASNTPENTAPEGQAGTADATSSASGNTNEGAESTETVYGNVTGTYTADQLSNGENPAGTMTVSEFAGHLTVGNILAGKGADGIVAPASVYQGIKAKRNPLPVVLVFAEGTDPADFDKLHKDAKVYLPVDTAAEAYNNRPERTANGASANGRSKRDYDNLLTDAAKATKALAEIEIRLNRAQQQYDKKKALIEKYHGWMANTDELTDVAGDADALQARIDADIAKKIEELDLAEDAAKNADIPDNTPTA